MSTCHYVGPFVDEVRCVGHAAIFDKSEKYGEKQDLLISVAAVLRSITTHYPDIADSSPMFLEMGLAAGHRSNKS